MSNTKRVITARLLASVAVVVLPFTSSCTKPAQTTYENKLANTATPSLHAVHDQRLRELMDQLGDMALERMPQELDQNANGQTRNRDIARIAESLAKTSLQIPDVLKQVRMSDDDRKRFEALATELSGEASALAQLAKRNEVSQMQSKLAEMINTCNACHESFRISPPLQGASEE